MTEALGRLNPEQRMAVETIDGPLLVLAGAGTGKTRVLTTRFAYLIAAGAARAEEILAFTFTNKAAREMRERVAALLGGAVESLWIGTFHATAARLLRRHAEAVGLGPDFTILDTDDQLRLIKRLADEQRIDPKSAPPRLLLAQIQRWKDRALGPEEVPQGEALALADGKGLALYRAYQERLRALNAADFGDLILHMVALLRRDPERLARLQRRFRYVMVDEYQDTNVAQYLWIRLLVEGERRLCCVGDEDQSIYSWRGAEVENILRFERDFPGARIIRLERNYRSSEPILAAASGLIAHNRARLGKTLRAAAADGAEGEKVHVQRLEDSDEEARFVAGLIERWRAAGERLGEIAILVRAGFQTRAFEEQLLARNVPYRVVGGLRFYERAEIRDALAYARLLLHPGDDLAFERILNVPKRGVGEAALRTLRAEAARRGVALYEAGRALLAAGQLRGRAGEGIGRLLEDLERARALLASGGGAPKAVERLLEDVGYFDLWRREASLEAEGRLENLREFLRVMGEFDSLGEFLDHVALVTELDQAEEGEKVSLMTLHAAKGLEFDIVVLPGWEEGLFPNARALEEGGDEALEEERRLAYVGLTRARRRAVITHARYRRIFGQIQGAMPSRFLDELPEACIDTSPLFLPSQRGRARPGVPFPPGSRVVHHVFGEGTVLAAEEGRVDVAFDEGGARRVLTDYVRPVSG
jgi:DNA helicase-2/ATP-dependent DNA helicase PcrA